MFIRYMACTHLYLSTFKILLCADTETPPVEYWQVLAEQRRQALADTLEENEEVYKIYVYV